MKALGIGPPSDKSEGRDERLKSQELTFAKSHHVVGRLAGLAASQSIYRGHSKAINCKWPQVLDGVKCVVVRRYDLLRRVPRAVFVDAGNNKCGRYDLQFNYPPREYYGHARILLLYGNSFVL